MFSGCPFRVWREWNSILDLGRGWTLQQTDSVGRSEGQWIVKVSRCQGWASLWCSLSQDLPSAEVVFLLLALFKQAFPSSWVLWFRCWDSGSSCQLLRLIFLLRTSLSCCSIPTCRSKNRKDDILPHFLLPAVWVFWWEASDVKLPMIWMLNQFASCSHTSRLSL